MYLQAYFVTVSREFDSFIVLNNLKLYCRCCPELWVSIGLTECSSHRGNIRSWCACTTFYCSWCFWFVPYRGGTRWSPTCLLGHEWWHSSIDTAIFYSLNGTQLCCFPIQGFGIMTNEPTYNWHVQSVQHYEWKRGLERQAVAVPGNFYPEERFLRTHMIKAGTNSSTFWFIVLCSSWLLNGRNAASRTYDWRERLQASFRTHRSGEFV